MSILISWFGAFSERAICFIYAFIAHTAILTAHCMDLPRMNTLIASALADISASLSF
jgi:hypothetical protein